MTHPTAPPQPIPPGELARGVPQPYVNLYEVSVVDGDDMVRIVFGAKTGPEGISKGPAVLMREEQAKALAEGILLCISERHKRAYAQAMRSNPPTDTKAQ